MKRECHLSNHKDYGLSQCIGYSESKKVLYFDASLFYTLEIFITDKNATLGGPSF